MSLLEWAHNRHQDLRYGLRTLTANRSFTLIAVITLALGIGATTAIFSVVNAVLLGSMPYREPDSIVAVWGTDLKEFGITPVSGGDFADWRAANHVFSMLAATDEAAFTLTGQGNPQFVISYRFSQAAFELFGTRPQLGRTFTPEEDRPGGPAVVVLGDRLWRSVFHADSQIVGKAITLEGHPFTVVGVMPPGFRYPQSVELWVPLQLNSTRLQDYSETSLRVLGRLRPGISLDRAQADMTAIQREIGRRHPDTDGRLGIQLTPLREQIAGDVKTPLWVLTGAVGCVLLIACANVANLFLVRGTGRRAEVAVRAALGASRGRLLGQFLTEGVLLAVAGGVLGLGLAYVARGPLFALFPRNIANLSVPEVFSIPLDGRVLGVSFLVTLFAGLVFGGVPAVQHAQPRLESLREGGRGATQGGRVQRFRSAMVVLEIALALVLLAGAGLLIASFKNLARSEFGFRTNHVAAAEIFLPRDKYPTQPGTQRFAFVARVLDAARALPGVQSAAVVNFLPLSGFWGTTTFVAEGFPRPVKGSEPAADTMIATPDYFATMGIPILAGRCFTEQDRKDAPLVGMVSQEVAKKVWGGASPLGRRINVGNDANPKWLTVVGIVGEVHSLGLTEPTHPSLYRPYAQLPYGVLALVARTTGSSARLAGDLEHAIWSVDPDQPVFRSVTLEGLSSESLAIRRVSMLLLTAFSVLALLLAAVGIYGVIAFSVAQRTHEIGVRMALGAQPAQVLQVVVAQGARLAFWGVGFGLLGALGLTRFLAAMLVGIAPQNATLLIAVSVLLAGIALAATYVPARRAASIDPMVALRGPGAHS